MYRRSASRLVGLTIVFAAACSDSGSAPATSASGPTISALLPASAPATGLGLPVTVTGKNFTTTSRVYWNGVGRATTYVSPTSLTFNALDGDVTAPGNFAVTVINLDGGGTSNTANFTVTVVPPKIIGLSPSNARAGSAPFAMTVGGANFASGMLVQWNGQNRTTTYQSATTLSASISAADVATAGSASIRVVNPATGDTSNVATFTITPSSAPQIFALSPPNAVVGTAGITLTVQGSNFLPGMVVLLPGVQRPTTYVSGNMLTATLSTQDLSSPTILFVSVSSQATGQTSNTMPFIVSTLATIGPTLPIPATLWQPPSNVIPSSGTYLYLEGEPGDYVSAGQTHLFTGPSSMVPMNSVVTTGTELRIGGWSVDLGMPTGLQQFLKGYYANAQRFPFSPPGYPGIDVNGEGRGCNSSIGWFVIDDLTYTGTTLSALTARFEQRCDPTAPALHGALRWSS